MIHALRHATVQIDAMEGDWNEAARLTLPPTPNQPNQSASLTTFAFDPSQELLWTGNEYVSNQMDRQIFLRKIRMHIEQFNFTLRLITNRRGELLPSTGKNCRSTPPTAAT